jgi:hypothetical protein
VLHFQRIGRPACAFVHLSVCLPAYLAVKPGYRGDAQDMGVGGSGGQSRPYGLFIPNKQDAPPTPTPALTARPPSRTPAQAMAAMFADRFASSGMTQLGSDSASGIREVPATRAEQPPAPLSEASCQRLLCAWPGLLFHALSRRPDFVARLGGLFRGGRASLM